MSLLHPESIFKLLDQWSNDESSFEFDILSCLSSSAIKRPTEEAAFYNIMSDNVDSIEEQNFLLFLSPRLKDEIKSDQWRYLSNYMSQNFKIDIDKEHSILQISVNSIKAEKIVTQARAIKEFIDIMACNYDAMQGIQKEINVGFTMFTSTYKFSLKNNRNLASLCKKLGIKNNIRISSRDKTFSVIFGQIDK